jgi:hypothetical protein
MAIFEQLLEQWEELDIPIPEYNPTLHQYAETFMAKARRIQADSNRSLSGPASKVQKAAIEDAMLNSLFLASSWNTKRSMSPLNTFNLVRAFEDMCRRNNLRIDEKLRPYIVDLLAAENILNAQALNETKPKKLIRTTLHNGSIWPKILNDPKFADFRKTPWIFKYVAVNTPTQPIATLINLKITVAALAEDEDLQRLKHMKYIFATAVLYNPSNPKKFILDGRAEKASAAAKIDLDL